ncbi:hypothetical protein Sste5346_009445 [Sporothrix stenoceras]|uniref:Metalloprotease m41 n=1 Tax=Sporothrix stenoceras TaxID=5173 RepID=A0ABR3YK06_9PEZI
MVSPDRLNLGARLPGETMEEYTYRLVTGLDEAQRATEEAQRATEEAQRATEEAQREKEEAQQREEDERRRRLEAEIETQRAREGQRQTARFAELLREELRIQNSQLQEKTGENNSQSLPAYLAQISRLQAHAVRLLPHILPGTIPAHVQRSLESETGSRSTSSQPTTSGRTEITNKYYPLQLRPWREFRDEVQRPGFAKISAALRESGGLPSRSWVQNDEKTLLEKMPLLALNQKGGLNEARTTVFLETVLLTPAARILSEYLCLRHGPQARKQVFFDTAVQSVSTVFEPLSRQSGSHDSASSSNNPQSVFPDCLVLCMDEVPTTNDSVQLIASAEHKPLHALRATSVSEVLNGKVAQDLVARLARQSQARLEKKKAKEQAEQRGQASASTPAPQTELEQERAPGATSKTTRVDRLTYFAYSLTQAFHYMFTAGLEFGYLATGEVLIFLRIPADDATTLYYHVSLFPTPQYHNGDGSSSRAQVPGLFAQAPYPAPGDAVDDQALAGLPVAQMVSFCEYALHAQRRSASWTIEQTARLARFPNLPERIAAQYAQIPSSRLGRRRYDDGDGDSDDDDGPSRLQVLYRHSRARTASPLQQRMPAQNSGPTEAVEKDIATSFLSTACNLQTRPRPSHKVQPPTLPYCSHACLLRLVQNGPLDLQCPNVALHQAARQRTGAEDDIGSQHSSQQHPLTSLELAQRIRDQLYDTPEVDCEYSVTHQGAVGYPFKLTLTGFGYTIVGKAVQHEHRRRLVHESRIYKALQPLQGSIIPVHLGLIRLHIGYPVLSQFVQLPYMMLLSYAGASMLGALLHDDVDDANSVDGEDDANVVPPEVVHHRAEAARTQAELARWGFEDEDDNASNFRWCAETGRAMRIDFDRAYLAPPARLLQVSTNLPTGEREKNMAIN